MTKSKKNRQSHSLTNYAWLSICAAVITIVFKSIGFYLTDSISFFSDALESSVNLVAAVMTMMMLIVAAKPPDEDHSYGHDKAEYFSSGVEGVLIIVAALSIVYVAVKRLIDPQPLMQIGIGSVFLIIASLVNFFVGNILIRAGKEYESIALEADGRHLMTDVWTSVGVIVGVFAVSMTGWQRLDPIIAILVAINIISTGWSLLKRTIAGLMDVALPEKDIGVIEDILESYKATGLEFHALRTRQAGSRKFVTMHVLVPGDWTVHEGHQLLEKIEGEIRRDLSNVVVLTHLESLDDQTSWHDVSLDRES